MENVKDEKKIVEREATKYTKEAGKIYKMQIVKIHEELMQISQKNPLAYEISRAIKSLDAEILTFQKERSDLMSSHLLRNEDGNWIIAEESQKVIDQAKEKGLNLIPTEFGYIIDGDEDAEFDYKEKMSELLNTEVVLEIKAIDVEKKKVKVGEERLPLLEVISDFYEMNQINLLELIGVLTGL
jgi:hypothetical protein